MKLGIVKPGEWEWPAIRSNVVRLTLAAVLLGFAVMVCVDEYSLARFGGHPWIHALCAFLEAVPLAVMAFRPRLGAWLAVFGGAVVLLVPVTSSGLGLGVLGVALAVLAYHGLPSGMLGALVIYAAIIAQAAYGGFLDTLNWQWHSRFLLNCGACLMVGFVPRKLVEAQRLAVVARQHEANSRTASLLHERTCNELAQLILLMTSNCEIPESDREQYVGLCRRALNNTREAVRLLDSELDMASDAEWSADCSTSLFPSAATWDSLATVMRDRQQRLETLGLTGELMVADNFLAAVPPQLTDAVSEIIAELCNNIARHADTNQPYFVTLSHDRTHLTLSASNTVRSANGSIRSDSTNAGSGTASVADGPDERGGGYGLSRLRKLARHHGGDCKTSCRDGIWTTTIRLPRPARP